MCRTVHAVLSTAICGVQMLVRVFMTIILMIENVIRMILQTLYNFISFMLQMLSLIPICIVFLLTARLKCFMCGGGGPCPVNRGGACDCIMSALAILLLFFIFRATGVLDKMFYSIGYAKAIPPVPARFVPTPGDITECSRNETDYADFTSTAIIQLAEDMTYEVSTDQAAVLVDADTNAYYLNGLRAETRAQFDTDRSQEKLKAISSIYEYLSRTAQGAKSTSSDIHGYDHGRTNTPSYDPNG